MARFFNADNYAERLAAALKTQDWNQVDSVRVAAKRRVLECVRYNEGADEIEKCRDFLGRASLSLRFSKLRHLKQAQDRWPFFQADAESAAIALETMPLQEKEYVDAKQRILTSLAEERIGEETRKTTSELIHEAGLSAETVCKSLARMRAEQRIVSRRTNRHLYHHLAAL